MLEMQDDILVTIKHRNVILLSRIVIWTIWCCTPSIREIRTIQRLLQTSRRNALRVYARVSKSDDIER
jgi:hypothetical protein